MAARQTDLRLYLDIWEPQPGKVSVIYMSLGCIFTCSLGPILRYRHWDAYHGFPQVL